MRAAQVSKPNGPFEIVERDVPVPGTGQIRVKVEACGVCHSDALVKGGGFPGLSLPRVPGHEIAGRVDALGVGVTFGLEQADEALAKMMENRVRFRAVLVP